MDAVKTPFKWNEESDMLASDNLVLRKLQEKVLKMSFQIKKQKKISIFVPSMEF